MHRVNIKLLKNHMVDDIEGFFAIMKYGITERAPAHLPDILLPYGKKTPVYISKHTLAGVILKCITQYKGTTSHDVGCFLMGQGIPVEPDVFAQVMRICLQNYAAITIPRSAVCPPGNILIVVD